MSDSAVNTTSEPVPPEEEAVFEEFQAYVRSIYLAASDGAIQSIGDAASELRNEVRNLCGAVNESRNSYLEMFSPAVTRFEQSAGEALKRLATEQEAIAKAHWDRTSALVRELSHQHHIQSQSQATHFESAVHRSIKKAVLVLVCVMTALTILSAAVVYIVSRP